jgi:hypothetical protein
MMNVGHHERDRRSYAAPLQSGDFDRDTRAAFDLLHPHVTWTNPLGEVSEGKLNCAPYAGQLLDALGDYSFSLQEVAELTSD